MNTVITKMLQNVKITEIHRSAHRSKNGIITVDQQPCIEGFKSINYIYQQLYKNAALKDVKVYNSKTDKFYETYCIAQQH